MHKGYQKAGEFGRASIPTKKANRKNVSRRDVERNKKITSDRIIVENFFGRQCNLWMVAANNC